MRAAVVLILVLLAGCAGKERIRHEYIETKVPVPIPCQIEEPAAPVYATHSLTADDSDFVKIRAFVVERKQRIAVEKELRRLLATCTNVSTQGVQ